MIDPGQFRTLVIRPALESIGLYSDAAANLLLGTALVESQLTWLRQHGSGPALGVYQIEPATHEDIWANFLQHRTKLADMVAKIMARGSTLDHSQLVWNLAYATAMARLVYFRRPEPLPNADDLAGLAAYWKACFNTPKGKGTVDKFMAKAGPHILATA